MKLEYETPLAERICFRPVEALASSQDPFQDTMDLFGSGYDPNQPVSSNPGDIEVDPWS